MLTYFDIKPSQHNFYFQAAAVGLALILVERFGRKLLLFLSAAICSISIALLGVYFYLEENMCLEDEEPCSSGIN